MICKSFEPIIDDNCRVLILGSMPGVKSLEAQEYYAHPQNRFWQLVAQLCNEKLDFADYAAKKAMLLKHHLALWDTLSYCEREGSLDSDITEELPNDIVGLLARYPKITTIICNGGKAANVFKKHFAKNLPHGVCVHYLHSTSPANARMNLQALADEWQPHIKP